MCKLTSLTAVSLLLLAVLATVDAGSKPTEEPQNPAREFVSAFVHSAVEGKQQADAANDEPQAHGRDLVVNKLPPSHLYSTYEVNLRINAYGLFLEKEARLLDNPIAREIELSRPRPPHGPPHGPPPHGPPQVPSYGPPHGHAFHGPPPNRPFYGPPPHGPPQGPPQEPQRRDYNPIAQLPFGCGMEGFYLTCLYGRVPPEHIFSVMDAAQEITPNLQVSTVLDDGQGKESYSTGFIDPNGKEWRLVFGRGCNVKPGIDMIRAGGCARVRIFNANRL